MSRSVSFSEISRAYTCTAQWDMAYGNRLAGSSLRRRQVHSLLSDGRAWGAGVAAWHASPSQGTEALLTAHQTMRATYAADIAEQAESGFLVPVEAEIEGLNLLGSILDHYAATAVRFPNLTRLEGELNVPIPSRTGRRPSSRYRFTGFLDGFTAKDHNQWATEFKLRTTLTPTWLIELSRQPRYYGWALRETQDGPGPVGVIVDERLKRAPEPPKLVKGRRKGQGMTPSHDKSQFTTSALYIEACSEYGVEPEIDTVMALDSRVWQKRTLIVFRESELDEAGQELVAAARRINELDSGREFPVRNAKPANCNACPFRQICANPRDDLYVDQMFERVPPKRERVQEGVPA